MRRSLHAAFCASLLCGATPAWPQVGAPNGLAPEVLFEKVSPSVWVVRTQDAQGRPLAMGSAVVIADGRLVTNCHVLAQAHGVAVARENVTYGATLEHADAERDLCLLKVANFSAPAVPIAPPESLRVGARVFAIGNPRGLETTISDGLLSGLRRGERDGFEALQITVPISRGSSGGGLFDAQGRLIGITTFMLRDAQNVNFALPAAWIAEVPARAQAALAARQASRQSTGSGASPAAAIAPRQVFEYRLRDRFTGNSQSVVFRLDRINGDELIFNDGRRVERAGGGVSVLKAADAGEHDLAMPPGGWVTARPEPGSTWRLDYTVNRAGTPIRMELTARATETSPVRLGGREYLAIRVEFTGYTQRGSPGVGGSGVYSANAWYAPELGRVVRFDARTRGGHGGALFNVDEVLELVDIRTE